MESMGWKRLGKRRYLPSDDQLSCHRYILCGAISDDSSCSYRSATPTGMAPHTMAHYVSILLVIHFHGCLVGSHRFYTATIPLGENHSWLGAQTPKCIQKQAIKPLTTLAAKTPSPKRNHKRLVARRLATKMPKMTIERLVGCFTPSTGVPIGVIFALFMCLHRPYYSVNESLAVLLCGLS